MAPFLNEGGQLSRAGVAVDLNADRPNFLDLSFAKLAAPTPHFRERWSLVRALGRNRGVSGTRQPSPSVGARCAVGVLMRLLLARPGSAALRPQTPG